VDIDCKERDLDAAGSAIQRFAPGGLRGLVVGGALAMLVMAYGRLMQVWRRGRAADTLSGR
jgi:hypothetical protein